MGGGGGGAKQRYMYMGRVVGIPVLRYCRYSRYLKVVQSGDVNFSRWRVQVR